VIRIGSAYESATHHRKAPPAFGPVLTKVPAKAPTPSAAPAGQ
jgi:hypothetical protein